MTKRKRTEALGPLDQLADRIGCEIYQLSDLPAASLTAMLEELLAQPVDLPQLSPGTVPDYVSAVARAVQLGHLSAARGRSLLYAAQLMVSATRPLPR